MIKFKHIRTIDGNKHAFTIAYVSEGDTYRYGMAVCNGDNFDRKIGRELACQRLSEKPRNTRNASPLLGVYQLELDELVGSLINHKVAVISRQRFENVLPLFCRA